MTWAIGASTGCCIDQPILAVLESLRDAGIAGVELATPVRHFDPWQPTQITAVRDALCAASMAPVSIHAPFGGLLDISDSNPHHRNAAIGAILTAASALKDVGGSIVVVHATDVTRHDNAVDERLHHALTSLNALGHACRTMNLSLALESPLPHLIGGHPDEFGWLLDRLEPSIGVCLDTSHTTLGHHWSRFLERSAGRLIHVHANDHRGHADDHLPPGDGVINWREVVAGLRATDYQGWVILELGCPNEPLAAYFRRAQSQFIQLLV